MGLCSWPRVFRMWTGYWGNGCQHANTCMVPALDFYRKTGLKPEAIHTLLKFLWIKDNMADVWSKARKWLHIAEYIVCCLTGEAKAIDEVSEFSIPPSLTVTPNKEKIAEMEYF
jgi:hypothetical protein